MHQHGERVVHVVGVAAADQGLVVLPVLVHRRALRRRFEDPAVHEEPDDPLEVVPYLRVVLDAREKLPEAERREQRVEDACGEPLRLALALRVASPEPDDPFLLRRAPDVGQQFGNEGPALAERLAKPIQEVGLPVVMARQRPEAQHEPLARYGLAVARQAPLRFD